MRKGFLFLFMLAVLAAVPGCGGSGKISGWVQDKEGNLVPLAAVSLPNGAETHTDAHGFFSFDAVPAGKTTVQFAADGHVAASQQVRVRKDTLTSVTQVLDAAVTAGTIADAAAGGTAADAAGNTLVLPANAVAGGGEKDLSGTVQVEITAVDPGSPEDMNLFAGSFRLDAGLRGDNASLEAYGAANVQVTRDGEAVTLARNATAELHIVLPEGTGLEPGDTVAAWHFNAATGHWEAEAEGTVTRLDDGTLVVVVRVSTFGWWCCGRVIQDPHCIRGTVRDNDGNPLDGATVVAIGTDYLGVTTAVTGDDGGYRVDVKPNAKVRLDVIARGAYYAAARVALDSGAPNDCTDQDVQIQFDACIDGFVKEEDGTPIAGEQVYSSTGGTAVTDENGHFCMPAPGDTHCVVYVLGRPPRVVHTPEKAACGDEGLVPVLLTVDFPKDGDMVGLVADNTVTLGRLIGAPRQYHTSKAMFCAGFDGEKFDLLMPGTLEDRYAVKTLHIDLTPQNRLAAYLGIALGPVASNLIFDVDFAVNGLFNATNPNAEDPESAKVENENDAEGGRIGPLDAGTPAPLTAPAASVELTRPFDFLFGDGRYGTTGFYLQHPLVSTDFAYGDAVTYTWPGGVDLGGFTLTGAIPGPIHVSTPASLENIFDLADGQVQDLPLAWDTNQTSGDFVTLVLETIVLDSETDSLDFGAALCTLVDDGEAVIPASVLAQLPHLPADQKDLFTTKAQVNCLFAVRHGLTEAAVPLLRGDGGNGRALLVTSSDPTMKISVAVDFRINLR